jgi:hypothetical protein
MSSLQRARAWLGTARYLARHPRETRRLPRWFRQRSLSPMDIRVPWWPYDAITWMAGHLPPGARVFEYGGGGSTLWLEDHGASVTCVEHHDAWFEQLERASPPRTRIMHRATAATGRIVSDVEPGFFDSYVDAIRDEPDASLDLVIVDGRARVECVRRAMPKVKPGGLLLLDDTGRPRYGAAVALLAGWERHVFEGLKPGDIFPGQTSVWRRPAIVPPRPGTLPDPEARLA